MDRLPPFSELVATLMRHLWLVICIVAVGIILSVAYALSQPRLYQTTAVVQIEQGAVQDPTTGVTGGNGATLQRLQVIEQRLMARDNLTEMIARLDLFTGEDLDRDEAVLALRTATAISQITDPNLRWRQDVAPTALMIQVTDGEPARAARIANAFVDDIMAQARSLRTQRVSGSLEFFASEEARISEAIAEQDARIATFKLENADSLPEAVGGQRSQLLSLEDNARLLDGDIAEARAATRPDTALIARLETQRAEVVARRAEVEAALSAAPDVERAFNALERELRQLTDQYDIVARSRAEAEMGQMLDTSAAADSFLVLERAEEPKEPIAPNRRRIVALGTLMSMFAALGLMTVLELRNPVLRTAGQMERRLGLRPVVSIPNIQVRSERLRRLALVLSILALTVLVGIVTIQLLMGR